MVRRLWKLKEQHQFRFVLHELCFVQQQVHLQGEGLDSSQVALLHPEGQLEELLLDLSDPRRGEKGQVCEEETI